MYREQVVKNAIEDHLFSTPSDVKRFKHELNVPNNRTLVLFVGSLLMYEGIDTLVDAVGPLLWLREPTCSFFEESSKHKVLMPGSEDFYQRFESTVQSDLRGRAICEMLAITDDERIPCVELGKKRANNFRTNRRVDELLALSGLA